MCMYVVVLCYVWFSSLCVVVCCDVLVYVTVRRRDMVGVVV